MKAFQKIPCPDCGKQYDPRGMHKHTAWHQRKAAPPAAAPASTETGPLKCDSCDFTAKSQRGLSLHQTTMHKGRKNAAKNGQGNHHQLARIEAAQTLHRSQIPETTLAVAYGRFIELCNSMAYEFDLPPRLFAAELATLINRARPQVR